VLLHPKEVSEGVEDGAATDNELAIRGHIAYRSWNLAKSDQTHV
jgi:hypothetical protein